MNGRRDEWMDEAERPLLPVAPKHLRGAERIAEEIGVRRDMVVRWYEGGAPISRVGRAYMCEYNALMAWLARSTGSAASRKGRVRERGAGDGSCPRHVE